MNIFKIATYSFDTRWFSAAMATILIAAISRLHGFEVVVPYFFIAGLAIFFSVLVFRITQVILFYKDSLHEHFNPEKNLYSFSIVGAISLAGVYLSKIFHLYTAAYICWYVAVSFWLIFSLSSFSILFLYQESEDRKIEDILHGGWFFAIAGTQFTAFLGVTVAEHAVQNAAGIQLFSFAQWSVGASLYLVFVVFIILRMVFYPFSSTTAISPYWMNIGAAALTALTGTALYHHVHAAGGPFTDFLPFLKGFSLFFWSIGLWWLPLLFVLSMRKQACSTDGLTFTVGYWEVVFALGLYAKSTIQINALFQEQYLFIASLCFSVACIVLWCFSSIFTLVHLIKSAVWVPVNDLTINYVVPYSFKLRGRIFFVKKVVNEWVDQTIQDAWKKHYSIMINNNILCHISYDKGTKKWYLDAVEEQGGSDNHQERQVQGASRTSIKT
ncbi:MAG: tellurite resistance/C4-dicarboxylate transporter family protein [Candidatus Loosdrechtia sp.]|uniref:tellurite resistance/C4-dicarboxylate transporter family protein n=1 Tax=Candidatus Loosdrechtia sp. TaxID=3101272 RepID=UPI003A6C4E52|nr:MAG: tellurite resistance/C4-dicarboxylate transporter family protein [Candidatus Jettenia sp. AMX2]